jgi:hypothetical protein
VDTPSPRGGGRTLTAQRYFVSVFVAGAVGDPRRVKMVDAGGVVR